VPSISTSKVSDVVTNSVDTGNSIYAPLGLKAKELPKLAFKNCSVSDSVVSLYSSSITLPSSIATGVPIVLIASLFTNNR